MPLGDPLDGDRLEPLGEADRAALLALFAACADFVRLTEGREPSMAQVDDLLLGLPPGRTLADKQVLGLRAAGGRLLCAVDLVRDYPAPDEWFLGLLLLHPEARGGGLGERAYRAVEALALARGATVMRLGVLEQNGRARRFWERLGFAAESSRSIRAGELESVAVRMVRRLGPGRP